MSKFADLAKQGIVYRPLSDASAEQAPKPEKEQGNFSRGFEKAMLQVPQTLGGSAALVGDLAGSEGLKEVGLSMYQKNSEKIQAITKDSDSLSNVLEGDASGSDWLANTGGYVAGQAVQALATGGVGGFIGSQLAKRGIAGVVARGANSLAAREVASKVAAQGAKWGAGAALLGNNLAQEAGSIYPEALNEAAKEGRELDGMDKARVVGSAVAAAGVDTAMDALMMGRVLKGARKPGESMLRAGVREVPGAMAREGVTEGIQTGIERYGAGQELSTADAIRDYVDSVGVGLVGGGAGGAASVLRSQKVQESGPLTRAANAAIEQQVLQLGYDPQPLISFPDGSVGHKQDLAAYLSQFTDPEERTRKEREIMGRDPETGKRIEPEPEPEQKFVSSEEAEQQNLQAWGQRHDGVPLDYAQSLVRSPGAKGMGLMIVPHPKGKLFTVIPSKWLTLHTQAQFDALQKGDQGMLPGPDREAPGGAIRVDANGEAAPETYGEQVRTGKEQRDQQAAASLLAEREQALGKPAPHGPRQAAQQAGPIPTLTDTLAPADGIPVLNDKIGQPQDIPTLTDTLPSSSPLPDVPTLDEELPNSSPLNRPEIPMLTDRIPNSSDLPEIPTLTDIMDPFTVMNPAGEPFKSEMAARRKQKADALTDTHTVLPVQGGFVLQPNDAPTGAPDAGDNAVLAAPDGAARGTGDQLADPAGSGETGGTGAAQAQPGARGTADDAAVATGEPDPVRAAGGADADPALTAEPAWRDKLIPAMSDAELEAAIEHYGPTHKRTPKLQKALDNRRAKADPEAKKPDWRQATADKEAKLAGQLKTANDNAAARAAQVEPGATDGWTAKDIGADTYQVSNKDGERVGSVMANSPEQAIRDLAASGDAKVKRRDKGAAKEQPNAQPEAAATPEATPARSEEAAPAPAPVEAEPARDDGADIPLAFYFQVKVPHEVHIEGEAGTETIDVAAGDALQSTRDDIAHLEALLKCMGG
jgi:hypothetical protein